MAYDLNRFFELSLDMLCIADMDGMFKHVNQAFETTLGWTREQFLNESYINFVHPHDRGLTLNEVEKLQSGIPTASFENRYRCADGSYKYLRWTTYPDQETGLLYGVARDVTETRARQQILQAKNERLTLLASLDGLTGIYNRRHFTKIAHHIIRLMQRLHKPVSIILFDVDHFKHINDTYGHPAGDEVLKTLAQCLASAARTSDVVARFGGEEFIAILPDADEFDALSVTDKLQRTLQDQAWANTPVTCSYGVATYRTLHTSHTDAPSVLTSLINEADEALYAAKHAGRDRAIHYTEINAARTQIG